MSGRVRLGAAPCQGARGLLGLALLTVSACAGAGDGREPLEVYAASSLTEAFSDIELSYEAMHPDVDVVLTFAGSQVLRLQIEQGARADVFASANPEHFEALVAEGLVHEGQVFVYNELVVIVPEANPAGIVDFADLPRAERLVLGTPNVPVGAYAREVLRRADGVLGPGFEAEVLRRVVSEETNVRLARAKVELGEADAAVVYATDAIGSDRIRVVPVPPELNVRASYLIGVVEGGRAAGETFVEHVLSRAGRDALYRHGFGIAIR